MSKWEEGRVSVNHCMSKKDFISIVSSFVCNLNMALEERPRVDFISDWVKENTCATILRDGKEWGRVKLMSARELILEGERSSALRMYLIYAVRDWESSVEGLATRENRAKNICKKMTVELVVSGQRDIVSIADVVCNYLYAFNHNVMDLVASDPSEVAITYESGREKSSGVVTVRVAQKKQGVEDFTVVRVTSGLSISHMHHLMTCLFVYLVRGGEVENYD